MTFSKAVFLTSLTCFTLGVTSGFATCSTDVTCSNKTGTDNCSGNNSFDQAIQCVNSDPSLAPITFKSPYTTSGVSQNPACITVSTDIVADATTTLGTTGDTRLICVYGEDITVTIGPSSSSPFVFDMGGYIQVLQGTLVFGPQVTYPQGTSESEIGSLLVEGASASDATLQLTTAGTMVTELTISTGTLDIAVDGTVFFPSQLIFKGSSKLTGLGVSTYCNSSSSQSGNFQVQDTLTLENVSLAAFTDSSTTGTIALNGNAYFIGEYTSYVTQNLSFTLTGDGNGLYAAEGNSITVEKVISGSGALNLNGLGAVILTGANTYSGGTNINFGSLTLKNNSGNAGTEDISIQSGAILYVADSIPLSNSLMGNDGGSLQIEGGDTLTLSGDIKGSGLDIVAVNSGTADIIFTGSMSDATGSIFLTNIDLTMGVTSSAASNAVLNLTTSSLNLNGYDLAIGGLSGDNSSTVSLGSGTLTINPPSDTSTFSTVISGTGGVTYQLASNITATTITPTGANAYTGETTIGDGITVSIVADSNIGSGGTVNINGGGTLIVNPSIGGSGITLNRGANIGYGTGTISVLNSSEVTLSGALSGTGALIVLGDASAPSTLTLTTASSFSGGITVESATLQAASTDYLGSNQSLTLEGGTFVAADPLTLSSGITVNGGGGTLSISSPNTLTVSGAIIGSGSLTVAGSGTIILSGSNEYGGGTILEAAELQIASNANLGDSSGLLTFSGDLSPVLTITETLSMARNVSIETAGVTFNVSSGATASLTGEVLLTNTPSVTKSGDGTLSILPDAVSTSPLINLIINAGGVTTNTLLLGNSDVDLTASGTSLTFYETGLGFYNGSDAGTIAGSGGVIVDGGGTLNMLIPENARDQLTNSYTGSTTLLSGILVISADGALGESNSTLIGSGGFLQTVLVSGESANQILSTRPVSLTSDTSTTFNTDKGTVLAIGGGITGSGNLIKSGKGVLILAEQNSSFTGTTSVNEGVLVIDDTTNSGSDITVTGPGKLTGTVAEIAAKITLASTIRASGTGIVKKATVYGNIAGGGNVTDVLEVLESLDIKEGAALLSKFNSQGKNSKINVGGPTTIEKGAIVFVVPEPGIFPAPVTFTILEGSSSGTFDQGLAPPTHFMKVDPHYGSVSVTVTPLTISLTGAGNNADAVAATLNDVIVWNRANVDLSIPGLDEAGTGKLEFVLSSLLPIFDTSSMNDALDQMHPASLKNLVISQENASVQVQESLSTRLNEEMETLDCAKTRQAYTFWINGMGSATNQGNNTFKGSPQIGYNNTMAGFIAGADYRFIDLLYVGALGGFTSSHVSFTKDRGAGDINTGYFGLYASTIGEGFFANVSVTGGWNGYQANRRIQYQDVDLTAKNSHGGRQLMSHLEGGLNLPIGRFNLRPFDRFDYLSQQEYGYKEKDAGDWNLSVNKNTSILIRNELGLQFASCFQVKTGKITVSPKASWVREVRTRGSKYTASFTDAEDFTFSVTGYFPNRSLFSTGGVITGALLEDKLSLSAYYDGEFATGYSAHRYGGEVRYSF